MTALRCALPGSLRLSVSLRSAVAAIRERFGRHTVIIVRADSGFCREEIMAWTEAQPQVHYVLGLARNPRLESLLAPAFWEVAALLEEDLVLCAKAAGSPAPPSLEGTARRFAELRYRTLESWSCQRRPRPMHLPPLVPYAAASVIGKAEVTQGQRNPRSVLTDLTGTEDWAQGEAALADGSRLYEQFYCARGNRENRIKEPQMDLFADRTSTAFLSRNPLRLARPSSFPRYCPPPPRWFSTFAYLLMRQVRAVALSGTRLAPATVGTIRRQLLKIAAQVTVSVRRIYVRLCSACPMQGVFAQAHGTLRACSG